MVTSALCGTLSSNQTTRQEFLDHLAREGGKLGL
jgi:hypothetical protein